MEYTAPNGQVKSIEFYHDGFKKKAPVLYADVDNLPKPVTIYNFKPKELIVRMLRGKCELCGKRTNIAKIYQVAALKDLDPMKEWDAKMIGMRRKSLVVCNECFERTQTDM